MPSYQVQSALNNIEWHTEGSRLVEFLSTQLNPTNDCMSRVLVFFLDLDANENFTIFLFQLRDRVTGPSQESQ